jgi:hypothetical protein
MTLKYDISYIFYDKDECKGSIKKEKDHGMSNTTPVRSPENKLTFPTLKFVVMSKSIGSAARTHPQVL